jgi:hypothetical protein
MKEAAGIGNRKKNDFRGGRWRPFLFLDGMLFRPTRGEMERVGAGLMKRDSGMNQ